MPDDLCDDAALSFILYTAGASPNSVQAVENLKAMCLAHFPEHNRIEIVDLLQDPQRGLADGIMVTPTLVKLDTGAETNDFGESIRHSSGIAFHQLERHD